MGAGRQDVFAISGYMRLHLVLRLLVPLFFIGVLLWAVSSSPQIGRSEGQPLILVGLGAWAVWELVSLVHWIGFSVAISGVGRAWRWEQVSLARSRSAIKFGTYVEIRSIEGSRLAIPAAIENGALLLTLLERHVPDLVREE